jgi:N-carbamoylputrescine amidase
MGKKIVVAAIQMTADLGDVDANIKRAGPLVDRAFKEGAKVVILPEFFTSGAAFSPRLLGAARPVDGAPYRFLVDAAARYRGYVGGSFIASRGGHNYNTFVWANPDGATAFHDKDQPTMWENCYYVGGTDPGRLDTPLGPVGVSLCWELVRARTARRLRGRVDLLVSGSCWWTVPDWKILRSFWESVHRANLGLMEGAVPTMARLLGVPVVHAAHAGKFSAGMPLMPGIPYHSFFLGNTQIVDAHGKVLAGLAPEDGEGIVTAEIEIGRTAPSLQIPDRFWISPVHPFIRFIWFYQNLHGRNYYRIARLTKRLKIPGEGTNVVEKRV